MPQGPGGVIFCTLHPVNGNGPAPPDTLRAVIFVDGQNLYHCVRETFGYSFPNYDVLRLAQHVCAARGWMLSEVRFYTGFPDAQDDAMWNGFWSRKLLAIKRQGVYVYSRPLRYRNRVFKLSGGRNHAYDSCWRGEGDRRSDRY